VGHRLSLRTRLGLTVGGSILLAVAVFAALATALVSRELHRSLDQALRRRAVEVAQLAVSAPALLDAPGALESPVAGRQIAVEVLDARGRILARSLTLGASLLPEGRLARAAIARGSSGYGDVRVDGHAFRLYAAPIADAGGPAAGGAVLVAAPTGEDQSTISRIALALAIAGAAVALAGMLVAALLTRRGLAPLRRLARAAAQIERTADPARRLGEGGSRDELGQLTGVLNRMLASLERAREGERRFLADASHELRTPVATLLGNVEYAVRHGADAEVLAELERDARRLARLVDDLLALERGTGELRPVALEQLVGRLAREHPAAARIRLGPLEPATALADAAALGRAISNLIDNAVLHGPPQGMVEVALHAREGSARLSVCDEGPGPASSERLFERFWRGEEAAGRPGSGLGLAIVAAVTERHHGEVEVDGSRFTLVLPLAAVQTAVTGRSCAGRRP
jgi:signal transduction histidine kinase